MSQVKAKDLRGLSQQELLQKKADLEKELRELNQKKISGQLDKPHHFKRARRQIAMILTITREK